MIKWIKENRWEFLLLCLLLILAAFFRIYRISDYMTFLGDEGRDALVIKHILVDHEIPFIGPPTSIGNIYLGPLYYYMMAVPMAISWLNPVAPAVMAALIGLATILLIYYLAREWFGKLIAFMTAFLYGISPVNIYYSRSSWNPNPAPFFALLSVLGLYKVHQSRNFLWLILTGGALAFAVQMHYLALILLPIVGALWIYEVILSRQKKNSLHLIKGSLGAVVLFLLLMSPLVIFDFRHNFLNYRAMSAFFGDRQTTVNLNILNSITRTIPVYSEKLVGRYMVAGNEMATSILAVIVLLPLIILTISLIRTRKAGKFPWPYFALGVWLLGSMVGLSLYKQTIYDHYLGFVNPAPYLLLGGLVAFLKGKQQMGVVILLLVVVGFLNLQKNPLLLSPNNQLKRTQEVAKFVIEKTENRPFNFALIAKSNYDAAYQYYLDLYGHKPKVVPVEITDQLWVVCEDQVCQPVGHAKYEIAAFGWAKIEYQTELEGVKIYKLVANPSGKPS